MFSTYPSRRRGAPAAPQTPVISHLNAVLRADGLAQELDAASPDARSGANGIWYVLSLKALESGGTLLKSGNAISGTKTSYSGGAIGTYALFRLNGRCRRARACSSTMSRRRSLARFRLCSEHSRCGRGKSWSAAAVRLTASPLESADPAGFTERGTDP